MADQGYDTNNSNNIDLSANANKDQNQERLSETGNLDVAATDASVTNSVQSDNYANDNSNRERSSGATYREETAAEVAPVAGLNRGTTFDRQREQSDRATGGGGVGTLALILSLLSLFFAPVLMGAAGIIIGFIARSRGAKGLGNWAIGIGATAMIIALFIRPFYY